MESGGLVELMPEWRSAPIPLYIVYAANRHLSARVRVFVDYDLPRTVLGRLLGPFGAHAYARWCVNRMLEEARSAALVA